LTAFERLEEGPYGALLRVLERSRKLGFLGPGPVEPHIERALDGLDLISPEVRRALDMGSGGGLPGLPLALALTTIEWVLLDGSVTRGQFLRTAVDELDIGHRTGVHIGRAEVAGRAPAFRATFDLVVARSFGPPAVTAECGAPFLAVGGTLVVAEPPGGSPDRWPASPLAALGLVVGSSVTSPSAFQVLHQERPCPERYPRRTGVPAKRPLF
jgi:16S rRNA (guanine527-N7)-methyltransferase